MPYTHTIAGNLSSLSVVKTAIFQLKNMGFDINKLSVIGKNRPTNPIKPGLWRGTSSDWNRADLGTSLFSLLTGAGMLFMQGVGLVVIAGPISSILAAKMNRAIQDGQPTFGGLMGAFDALEIARWDALQSSAQIQAGQLVMLVSGSDRDLAQVQEVLATVRDEIDLPTAI